MSGSTEGLVLTIFEMVLNVGNTGAASASQIAVLLYRYMGGYGGKAEYAGLVLSRYPLNNI
jgi:hypothetical protein